MKITWSGVEWGETSIPGRYFWYFYWSPGRLEKGYRHLGVRRFWYDGPHAQFGFWFFVMGCWSTYYTLPTIDSMSNEYRARWEKRPHWLQNLFGVR